MITDTAMAVLEKRYLQKDKNGKVVETPDQMLMRVATHIAAAEEAYGYNSDAAKDLFYGMMSRLEFLPNSPTLMNAGTDSGQLAACFVLPVEDSLTKLNPPTCIIVVGGLLLCFKIRMSVQCLDYPHCCFSSVYLIIIF